MYRTDIDEVKTLRKLWDTCLTSQTFGTVFARGVGSNFNKIDSPGTYENSPGLDLTLGLELDSNS